jgi:hypothetical protein
MTLPWRGATNPPIDPDRLPIFRGVRPRKRWRYLGVYGPDVQMCVGVAHIGPAYQAFWAVHNRRTDEFRDRAALWPIVHFDETSARFDRVDVTYRPAGEPVQVVTMHGAYPIWTRKTPVRITGTIDGISIDSPGLVDETAGHHARVTRWLWSAGCGTSDTGAAITWNLVEGVHDSPTNSERTVWVDGVPQEVGPQRFAPDLSRVGDLQFHAESERSRHDRMILVDSKYSQPFGTFTGSIAGVTLREGYGVMERHDVRW